MSKWIFLVFACLVTVAAPLDLTGPNICTRIDAKITVKSVSYHKPYQVRTYTWCLAIPPRCSRYRISYSVQYRDEPVASNVTIEECCKGFVEVKKKCVPFCSQGCANGECVGPEKCKCLLGYGGTACNIFCCCKHALRGNGEMDVQIPALVKTEPNAIH